MGVGHFAFAMSVATTLTKPSADSSCLQPTTAKYNPSHLMTSALVIDDIVGAELGETEEARSVDGFAFVVCRQRLQDYRGASRTRLTARARIRPMT